jgi:hypothetical protein
MFQADLVDAPSAKLKYLKTLQLERQIKAQGDMGRYYNDRVAWAHDCIAWTEGQGLTEYQDEVLAALDLHDKVSVRSLHGAGKTMIESVAILHFATTRDALGIDWKAPVTAGAWRQLIHYLFPELHRWAKQLRWEKIGRDPFQRDELLTLNLNLTHGSAFAVASDTPAFIEGAHADELLYVFDEARAIPVATFDAAEGAFSGGKGTRAFALACSTPGEPTGRFYEIQTQKPGTEDWHAIHVSLPRAVAAGRVSQVWADQRALQWGKDSALFANRVLGEFHASDSDGVIPLSWVEAAVERWQASAGEDLGPLTQVGADIARSGSDSTVLALRHSHRINELRTSFHQDTMETSGRIGGVLRANSGAVAVVDTDGLGAGVTDRLREQGYAVVAFHGGAKSERRDRSGELGFLNLRAQVLWALREALDPSFDPVLELPPDDALIGELTAAHWTVTSNSRIQIESKDEIRKRLGRSTDRSDAVAMSFWVPRVRRRARMGDIRDTAHQSREGEPDSMGPTWIFRRSGVSLA